VKLGSSDDDTTIATTMGDVEAMMDPEEKSTNIQTTQQPTYLATGFDLQRNKNGEFINDFESLACVIQWFGQKNNNSTDFLFEHAGIEDYQRKLL
jgi:hypothetical protein